MNGTCLALSVFTQGLEVTSILEYTLLVKLLRNHPAELTGELNSHANIPFTNIPFVLGWDYTQSTLWFCFGLQEENAPGEWQGAFQYSQSIPSGFEK